MPTQRGSSARKDCDMRKLSMFLLLFFSTGCTFSDPQVNDNLQQTINPNDEVIDVIANDPNIIITQLNVPWSITKDDNIFYISQRGGSIVAYNPLTKEKSVQAVNLQKPLNLEGEGGFLGLELTPNFIQSKQAFAYYTYQVNGNVFNRISIIELADNQWQEVKTILDEIPGAVFHNGGRIKIGPDEKLYITIGDGLVPENAQNLSSLNGKILRLKLDGSIPADNPFPQSYIYSYGHRNPQGLAWDESGTLYSSEHGQSAHDEINVIKPGKNYGWPIIQGDETAPNMEKPLFHSGTQTWAPSGISYYNGKLYVAALRGEHIRAFDLKNISSEVIYNKGGRMRDTFIDNQTLYFVSNNRDGRGNPDADDDRMYKLTISDGN